jgi:hypothetical protein
LTSEAPIGYKTAVAAHLFIVSRLEPDLYTYLAREFSSEDDVRVILDRRVGERRAPAGNGGGAQQGERRQGDRRRQSHVARQIRSLGYAFVRLDT